MDILTVLNIKSDFCFLWEFDSEIPSTHVFSDNLNSDNFENELIQFQELTESFLDSKSCQVSSYCLKYIYIYIYPSYISQRTQIHTNIYIFTPQYTNHVVVNVNFLYFNV